MPGIVRSLRARSAGLACRPRRLSFERIEGRLLLSAVSPTAAAFQTGIELPLEAVGSTPGIAIIADHSTFDGCLCFDGGTPVTARSFAISMSASSLAIASMTDDAARIDISAITNAAFGDTHGITARFLRLDESDLLATGVSPGGGNSPASNAPSAVWQPAALPVRGMIDIATLTRDPIPAAESPIVAVGTPTPPLAGSGEAPVLTSPGTSRKIGVEGGPRAMRSARRGDGAWRNVDAAVRALAE